MLQQLQITLKVSYFDQYSEVMRDTPPVTFPFPYVLLGSAVHFPKVQRSSCFVEAAWKTTIPLMQLGQLTISRAAV